MVLLSLSEFGTVTTLFLVARYCSSTEESFVECGPF